jgi:hypothetical protein
LLRRTHFRQTECFRLITYFIPFLTSRAVGATRPAPRRRGRLSPNLRFTGRDTPSPFSRRPAHPGHAPSLTRRCSEARGTCRACALTVASPRSRVTAASGTVTCREARGCSSFSEGRPEREGRVPDGLSHRQPDAHALAGSERERLMVPVERRVDARGPSQREPEDSQVGPSPGAQARAAALGTVRAALGKLKTGKFLTQIRMAEQVLKIPFLNIARMYRVSSLN